VIPRRCYSRRTFVPVSLFDVTFDRIKALSAAIGRLIAQQVQAVRQAGQGGSEAELERLRNRSERLRQAMDFLDKERRVAASIPMPNEPVSSPSVCRCFCMALESLRGFFDFFSNKYRGLLMGAMFGSPGIALFMGYGRCVTIYFAEDWGGGEHESWTGAEVQSVYSEWLAIGTLAAMPLIPLTGWLIDRIGSLPIMYAAGCCFAAQSTALVFLPPSQMLFTVIWATCSAPPLLFNTALNPFLLRLLPNMHKVTRDAGLFQVLLSASGTVTTALYGSILVSFGTTGKLMLVDREQTPLQGYRTFFTAANVVAVLAPTAFHLAAGCFSQTTRRSTALL